LLDSLLQEMIKDGKVIEMQILGSLP